MGINLAALAKEVHRVETIVTRPVSEYLRVRGDDALSPVVAAWVGHTLGTQPRIRSGSYSGASAGSCLRAQELAYAGVPGEVIDVQTQNIFNDGKWRHLRWQAMLLETGCLTDVEYLVQWPDMLSRGSLDGRGEVPLDHPKRGWRGKEFGFELKGVSTFQYTKLAASGPKPEHLLQVHHYFVLGNLDLFSIVYEDKTTQAFHEWVIEPDPVLMHRAEQDIRQLAADTKSKTLHRQLPECVVPSGDVWRACPFGQANGMCHKALADPPKPFLRSA